VDRRQLLARMCVAHRAYPEPRQAIACGALGVVLEDGEVWRHNNGLWENAGTLPPSAPVNIWSQS
jgi:hypothetical protein